MKIHNKAILIGSNSGGGAHPVAINLLESGIALKIPIGRTYDPVSDLDWEGTGVIPDIECSEDEALEITRKKILKHQSEMSE